MQQRNSEQQTQFLRNLVITMVRAVVENEEDVDYHEVAGDHNIVLEVYVNDDDIGLVLGHDGHRVQAMRNIVFCACKKTQFKYSLDIIAKSKRRRSP